jgi:hypothetical protein
MTHYNRFNAFCQTSNLWNGSLCGIKAFTLSQFRFALTTAEEQELELPVIPARTVLGKRAEYFFKFCVEHSTNYELLVHNMQIFKENVTLGELDYIILETRNKKMLHVELVYKFYLYDPLQHESKKIVEEPFNSELAKYVGPNRRDNFLYKLNRLKTHQLPLLYTPQAQESLGALGINVRQVEQQVCFLAHVFIPRELWQHDFKYVNKKCIAGYYMCYSAFAKAETANAYFLPEKYAWKMKPHVIDSPRKFTEICEDVKQSLARGFAPLLWMQLENRSFECFFVIQET